METSDRPQFVEVLAGLAAIKRADLTKEALKLWWRSMNDWSIDEFSDAAGYLLKNCQFMPQPYDFTQLRKVGDTSAYEAWSLALEHASGGWRYGLLSDTRIDTVVAMLGGYSVVALTSMDKLGFLEHRFKEAYNDLLQRDGVRKELPDLTDKRRLQNGSGILTIEAETD